jgi:hypothetical protein
MKSNVSIALVSSALAFTAAAQGEIYKYVDPATGAVEYTNQPKRGAVRMNSGDTLSEMGTGNKAARNKGSTGTATVNGRTVNASNNASAGTAMASVDAGTQKTRDGTRRQVLIDELTSEEKLLNEARASFNEGKPLPMADEGLGSPKYIDRVKQLEKTLRVHGRNVVALKQELANLKL